MSSFWVVSSDFFGSHQCLAKIPLHFEKDVFCFSNWDHSGYGYLWLYSGTKGLSFSAESSSMMLLGFHRCTELQRFSMFQPLFLDNWDVQKTYASYLNPTFINRIKNPSTYMQPNQVIFYNWVVAWQWKIMHLEILRLFSDPKSKVFFVTSNDRKRWEMESHWQVIIFTNADSVSTCNACGVDAVSVFAAACSARTNGQG